MKKTIILLFLAAMAMGAEAQSSKSNVTAYGAGLAEIAWVKGTAGMNIGAYGGVLINHRFLIGASGHNLFFKQTVNGKKENFQLNYYGLYSEYRIKPTNAVHISLGVTGALGWQENDVIMAQKSTRKDGDYTYVIQPKIGINTKVTKFMQVQAYGSYRITGNTKSLYYKENNYNGPSAGVSLVFGGF
jgi:Outer membrane protein beta-barrel domain